MYIKGSLKGSVAPPNKPLPMTTLVHTKPILPDGVCPKTLFEIHHWTGNPCNEYIRQIRCAGHKTIAVR